MSKNLRLIASFLAIAFLAVLVGAIGDFDINDVSQTSFTLNPGGIIKGNFSINNTNLTNSLTVNFPEEIKLTGAKYSYLADIYYNITSPHNLANNSKEYVSYNITLPSDIYNDSYSANINITAGAGNWDNFSLSIFVNSKPNLSVTNINTNIVRGYSKSSSITLTNIGNTDITNIGFTASNLTKGSDYISSGNIILETVSSINYRGSGVVNVTISVPSNQAIGEYKGNISINYDGKTVISYLTVNVEPVLMNLFVTNSSATWVRGISTAETAAFTINNTGNVNLTNINWTIGRLTYNSYNLTATITPDIMTTNLTPSETKQVLLTISNIPSNQVVGEYKGNITVNWGGNNKSISTLTVTVTQPSYSIKTIPETITFGSVELNSSIRTSFNLTNNGNAPLHNVNLVSNLASKYNARIEPTSIGTLLANQSRLINVNVTVPIDEPTDYHSLGSVSVKSDEFNSSFNLYVDVRGKLDISDIDVYVDGESDKNLNDGDKIDKEAKPLSTVKFDVRVDNRFSDNEDIDIEDIEITITIEEIDDGDDLEETLEEFDLKANKFKRIEQEFKIPLKVDEGTYNVIISAEGEDEEGVRHKDEANLKLEVDRENHKVVIEKLRLLPSEISCEKYATLELIVTNIGSSNEDETVISITGSELGININEQIELDEEPDEDDNSFEKSYTIEPSISAGKYPIDVRVYYDMDEISDYIREYLTIKECKETTEENIPNVPGQSGPESGKANESVVLVTGEEGLMPPAAIQPSIESLKKPDIIRIAFTRSNAYLALLVLANIGLVVVIIVILVRFLFMRRA